MTFNRRWTRSILLGATALTGALTLSATQASAQERRYDFDVPAQPLNAALQTFARQAQLQVIFAEAETKSLRAPPLNGSYSADEALQVLLAGTDLKASRNSKGVLQVAVNADPQSGSAAGGGAEVEALIVTAQKREEDIQDVPIAISAFTQEALERSQIAGGPDLMTQVPNMTFTKTNFSSYSIQIRGIGTQAISATTDPAVAIAFNNTPFVRNRFFEQEFYDLQRVEVLRGPQGTLYGRNATAGVVNIISQKPKFSYEAKLSGDVSNYSSTRLEGMVNVPLVEDVVALRLAGAWTKREGFVTNEITGNPIDGRDLWSTRLSLRFAPTDRLDVNLIWEHFEEDDDRLRSGKQLCKTHVVTELNGQTDEDFLAQGGGLGLLAKVVSQGCTPESLYSPDSFQVPNGRALPYYNALAGIGLPKSNLVNPYIGVTQSRDLRVIESTVDPEYRANSDLVELQFTYDLTDALSLTSETAWASDFIFSMQDFNRFNTQTGAWQQPSAGMRTDLLQQGPNGGIFCDPQIGCADRLVGVDLSTATSSHFSQEFRLGSDFDGPFNFSLGANFLRYDTEDKYYVFINSLTLHAAHVNDLTPWEPGVSDNGECLERGPVAPRENHAYEVTGCKYIDPNPIGSLNDLGHNYFLSKNPFKLISYAVFGEAYYNITDALKVTAGLRWTVDKKEAPNHPSWLLASETAGHPAVGTVEQEWREPTGRLTVDWKPSLGFTDDTLLYASYAHGYKAGGANPPLPGLTLYAIGFEVPNILAGDSTVHPKTFDAEFVDAFEIGAKNTLLDGALTFNLAAFYYDYKSYQISQIVNRSALNSNFDAEAWGLEIESDWRPLENLKLGLKLGYEGTRVADGRLARVANRAPEVMVKVTGRTRDPGNLRAHLDYISRNGELEMEDRDGNLLIGRPAVRELADDWSAIALADSRRRASTPFSLSVVLSMPADTDPATVRDAARAFARELFADRFDYVFALHTDAQHPHVHLAIRSLGDQGERLNPKKADLETWRQVFAEALRDRGVEAEATPRRARGVTRKAERTPLRKIRERHEAGDGELPKVRRAAYRDAAKAAFKGETTRTPWETRMLERQARVRGLYLAQAQLLGRSPDPADRALGSRVEAFVRSMPQPDSQRLALARELRAANRTIRGDRDSDGRDRGR